MQATVSVQAMEWVLLHSDTTGTDRLVLLSIANHADRNGAGAYPSAATIAAEANVHRVTAFRSIERLESMGAIEVVHGGGRHRPNTYRIVTDKGSQTTTVSPPENGSALTTDSEPETVAETVALDPGNGSAETRNGSAEGSKTVALSLPEPTTNQKQPTTEPSFPPSPSKRGCRLPEDFALSNDLRRWAAQECPTVAVDSETAKFRDYWRAKAGKDASKLDWPATWRNWIRNAAERQAKTTNGHSRPTGLDAVAEYARQEGLLA